MYTYENLLDDVRKEAENLKVHAMREEINRLDISFLNPRDRNTCIYGMVANDCHSDRAIDLIEKCCVRYFKNEDFTSIKNEGFNGIVKRVNGATVREFKSDRQRSIPGHYSVIEAYILLPEAKNANLIAFLKGETETLEL